MRFGKFQFQPGWLATAATVCLLPLFILLGLWQLDRAEQKRALIENYVARSDEPPLRLVGEQADAAHMRNRRVFARGHYDSSRQLLLDNKIQQSRPGYHVLTPFFLSDEQVAVLVNRGWVPLGASRERLPEIGTGEQSRTVTGVVHVPSPPPLALGDSGDSVPGWPKVIQRVDRIALEQRLQTRLLPYTVRLSPQEDDGYIRDWKPHFRTPTEKHQAYAVTWFGFAVLLLVLFVGLNLSRIHEMPETR